MGRGTSEGGYMWEGCARGDGCGNSGISREGCMWCRGTAPKCHQGPKGWDPSRCCRQLTLTYTSFLLSVSNNTVNK